jgi:hypothetical protein
MRPPAFPSPRSSRLEDKFFSFKWVIGASPPASPVPLQREKNLPLALFSEEGLDGFENHYPQRLKIALFPLIVKKFANWSFLTFILTASFPEAEP